MNNKGRYHNDYSPRYQDAFDIYEKAKNHAKEQRKKESLEAVYRENVQRGKERKEEGSISL